MDALYQVTEVLLSEAKKLGADFAVCAVSESEKREFNVDGGRFSLMRTLFDRNVSLTVLREHRNGSVHVNRFDEEALKKAVAECMAACESAEPDEAWEFAKGPIDETFTDGTPECDTDKLFARTKELMEQISERHPKILMEQMITEHSAGRVIYRNTDGVCYRTLSGSYSFQLMYSAHEGEKSTSFFGSGVTLADLDKPIIECAFLERELTDIERQLDTQALEGKFIGTALLAPSALTEIVLDTMLGNFMTDGSLIDGTSIWKDKLNEQVADPRFSLSLTPRADYVVDGRRYTEEGYPAENCDLIRGGRLVSFALSQYGANKTGFQRAATDGWNLTVPAGDQSLDSIIAGIDRGILVMRFSGGSPAASGEFSGVAKNSFLIENGKIAGALTETMISGCVPDMLNQIRAISSDVLRDGFMSLPYMAFDGVTISGK
ncbi:MAG: TldD/PmbA family protein [Clostridia bacterium]|nr:TldD/PmbA family protein [Clostridia bacterium]